MSHIIKSDQPCPCGASDAFATYDDGSGYCFSSKCGQKYYSKVELNNVNNSSHNNHSNSSDSSSKKVKILKDIPADGQYISYSDKGIAPTTLKTFGVTVYTKNGVPSLVKYPGYGSGSIVAANIKDIEAKDRRNAGDNTAPKAFKWYGDVSKVDTLFGAHLFPKGGKYITITEGQDDAMAGYQMFGSKYPFVSIIKGIGSAVKEIEEHFEYLNSFEHIVFCFDSDEHGRKRALECARKFPGKAKIVSLVRHKDAADYLKAGEIKEFVREWWAAPTYHPSGVIHGVDKILEVASLKPEKGVPLIWPGLNDITLGVRKNEIWTFGAGTGVGKSECFKEIMFGLMRNECKKVGGIFLEEASSRTIQCLLAKEIGWRYYLDGSEEPTEEQKREAAKELGDYLVLADACTPDWTAVKEKIEYFVRGLGCEYIFLDHITAIAEGKDQDVNSYIHMIMEEMRSMLSVDSFSIFMISHLNQNSPKPHEEGGRVRLNNFYGSGAIKQWSNYVFGLEGDQQAEDPEERNQRYLRCLKDRQIGTGVGSVIPLFYDHKTGRLNELCDKSSKDYDELLKHADI